MKPLLVYLSVLIMTGATACLAIDGDKIDVSTIITTSDAEAILGEPVKEPDPHNEESTNGYVSKCTYRTVKSTESDILRPVPLNRRDSYTQPRGAIVVPTMQSNKMLKIEVHQITDKTSAERFFMISGPSSWIPSVDGFGKKTAFELVSGIGDKAAFLLETAGEKSRSRLHVLKGSAVVMVGIAGVSDAKALEEEKKIAAKILVHL